MATQTRKYEIQVLAGRWTPDGLGEPNAFATVDEARIAVADLRKLGPEWSDRNYRIQPITQDAK